MIQSRVTASSLAFSLVALVAILLPSGPAYSIEPTVEVKGSKTTELNINPLRIESLKLTPAHGGELIQPGDFVSVKIKLELDHGFHAYLNQFSLEFNKNPQKLHLSELQARPTVKFRDPITKKSKVGTQGVFEIESILEIPKNIGSGELELDLSLTYQACAKDYCLLPKKIPLHHTVSIGGKNSTGHFLDALNKGWLYALIFVFFAGILTSFTPCIFPMIPITLAIIGSKGSHSRFSGFIVSIFYVLGIAMTYAILGVFAAKSGALFGSYLGHPVVVSVIAFVFVLMGLSMFGAFAIQMPLAIANRLSGIQTKKNIFGAFVSGLVAGVVASPCVGPVLVGILTYVAQTQNTVRGFVLLFTFALGLGQLFILLGTFQSILHKLPRSGPWMDNIKKVFGVVMFGMAIYYLYPVVKGPANRWVEQNLKWTSTEKRIGSEKTETQANDDNPGEHRGPKWVVYSDEALAQAIANKKPVIIDFNAEWCAACKELEKKTFSDPRVLELGSHFVWLTFDATSPSQKLEELQRKYDIAGLPHIVIYDSKGTHRTDLTLTGFEPPEEFLKRIGSL